jgi:Uncharacterized membrane protein
MLDLLLLWLLVEVLGVLCLPLSFTLLHNLPDRGWAFSKILGIVVVAFCIWFPLMCVPLLPYSRWFIAGVMVLLSVGGGYTLWRMRQQFQRFACRNRTYVVMVECVFTGMMVLLGVLRSYNPNIQGFEMYMDEGFVSAIMRSPHFPPNDMWLSGYSINYYYYAHYTIATLAKLLGQSPSIAFNTGISLFFGLTAVNLFGVACNIVAWSRHYRRLLLVAQSGRFQLTSDHGVERSELLAGIPFGCMGVFMGLILGNLAATQQWWQEHGNAGYHFNWFTPSRVIANTINEFPAFSFLLSCFHAHVLTMAFTILCIALAFNCLLAENVQGLALFGRGWRLPVNFGLTALILGGLFTMNGWDYPTYSALVLVCIMLQQGFACKAVHRSLLHWSLFLHIALITFCVIALSYIFYLPFYLHFNSPSQGIGVTDAAYRSPLSNELLIYGLFAFVFLSLLLASALKRPLRLREDAGEGLEEDASSASHVAMSEMPEPVSALATVSAGSMTRGDIPYRFLSADYSGGSAHVALSRLRSVLAVSRRSVAVVAVQEGEPQHTLETRGAVDEVGSLPSIWVQRLSTAVWRSYLTYGVLIGVGVFLLGGLLLLRCLPANATLIVCCELVLLGTVLLFYHAANRAYVFTLLCGVAAFTVIAGCELFFLKDIFAAGGSQRMNTIFKFYFQAWALLSLAAAAGLYYIWDCFWPAYSLRAWLRWCQRGAVALWGMALLLLIAAALVYPLVAPSVRLARIDVWHPQPYLATNFDLDGLTYMESCAPPICDFATDGDYKAIRWLNAHITGAPVIVEALGDDYRYNGRVSTFTGLPTLMGWVGHEEQWRINWLNAQGTDHWSIFNRRVRDIEKIYTSPSADVVLSLMTHYHVQYLYVGPYEYKKYNGEHLERYGTFMQMVYDDDGVFIYKVK